MRRLVVAEVVVTEVRHLRHPLPLVAREVGDLELVLTARMVGRVLVQRGEDLVLAHHLPAGVGTCPPRVGGAGRRVLTRARRGLRRQVHGKMTEPAVGADEVLEVRAPRPRQRDHDDRPLDRHPERLRVLVPVPPEEQPVRRGLHALTDEDRLVRLPHVVVGLDLAEQRAEPRGEVLSTEFGGTEVVETGIGARGVEHALDAHVERLRLGRLERGALLGRARVLAHAFDPQDLV